MVVSEEEVFWPLHLTKHEQDVLDQFEAELRRTGDLDTLSTEGTRESLCRYLKARKFTLEPALHMYRTMVSFRKEHGVDQLLDTFEFGELDEILECYPQFYHGVDRFGRPIYYELMGGVDVAKLLKTTTKERYLKFHLREWERLKRVRFPSCSKAVGGKPIFTSTTIFDCKHLPMRTFNAITRDMLKTVSAMDMDNYPEHLGTLFIINVPSFFSMVYAFISKFLDDRTRNKIHVLSAKQINKIFDIIPADQFPAALGGKCNCACPGGCFRSDKGPWNDPQFRTELFSGGKKGEAAVAGTAHETVRLQVSAGGEALDQEPDPSPESSDEFFTPYSSDVDE